MPIEVQIPDDDLKGFSDEAQNQLREKVSEYAISLIEEANRIEAGRNSTSGPPEITRGMVYDATILMRRGLGIPRVKWGLRGLRILAAVLSLFAGFMYNESKLQSGAYMLLFILVVTAAILCVTISTFKE